MEFSRGDIGTQDVTHETIDKPEGLTLQQPSGEALGLSMPPHMDPEGVLESYYEIYLGVIQVSSTHITTAIFLFADSLVGLYDRYHRSFLVPLQGTYVGEYPNPGLRRWAVAV